MSLPRPRRLGKVVCRGDAWGVEWVLKRNCSLSPAQLGLVYASLCVLSLVIASCFWALGARWVMPFAWVELIGLGAALLAYARHAGDSERIALQDGRLRVERHDGSREVCVEFQQAWVRVEPQRGDDALVLLSGQGRQVEVGRHLRPELRRNLAEELRTALCGRALA
ncbi:DUF2244 domain-containing protein [Caldimonas brevitalea]|uniref:Membrane protein n=1 Tax=Caldimonas brevitalea TaxID=413882 RepID=A0A0G3BKA1_9BURK|nr:DUF2244 domain-containing protein [Caldimonas brevitalea]AKJ27786.1 membrane protein [Caldimonas brevitalea]